MDGIGIRAYVGWVWREGKGYMGYGVYERAGRSQSVAQHKILCYNIIIEYHRNIATRPKRFQKFQ